MLPPDGAGPFVALQHLVMPAACLVLLLFAYLFRMTRASTIEALGADYTRTAVLKGLSPRVVMRRHVLRNALVPVVTMLERATPTQLAAFAELPGVGRGAHPSEAPRDPAPSRSSSRRCSPNSPKPNRSFGRWYRRSIQHL